MPLPLLLVIPALLAAGAGGTAIGGVGVYKMKEAKSRCNAARGGHEDALAAFRTVETQTQDRAQAYGQRQLRVQARTLGAWLNWLETNEKLVRRLDRTVVDGVQVQVPDIPTLRVQVLQGADLLKGGAAAVVGAVAAQQAALFGVRALATASTGVAISGLSGAAAESATMAWLGGGAIAAGGGGVAMGAMVLTGVAIAPALLIGGFTLGTQGEQALTKAREIEANVNIAVAEMDSKKKLLRAVQRRITELQSTLDSVNTQARASLKELRGLDFDPERHIEQFQRTALLMAAIGEILSTPILNADGNLTAESLHVKEKYAA